MKLLEEFSKHQDIFYQGYRFNPEDEVFFTHNLKSFHTPEGYESWKVQQINPQDYLNERLNELGLKTKDITTKLLDKDGLLVEMPIFTASIHGDIEILQYSLRRKAYIYEKSTTSAGTRWEYNVQKRLNPSYALFCEGKYDFSESLNQPFWHPRLIEAFEQEEKVQKLVITEGQIKAYKATHEGIYTVGLTSISHFRNKKFNELHPEIIEFIKKCNVEEVVILWDGDARNISSKQLDKQEELTKRPGDFYRYACAIRNSLYKFLSNKKVKVYFASIRSYELEGEPKGIDDLLMCSAVSKKQVVEDFQRIGEMPCYTISTVNLTREPGLKALRTWFKLDYVGSFYDYHKDQIGNKSFIYYGNTYKIEKGAPVMEISADLKEYKLIGTDFYRLTNCTVPTGKEGETIEEKRLIPWKSEIIKLHHGKDALHKLEVFKGFTNIPSHTNYQQVINNEWNLYFNVEHDKQEGEFPTIQKHLKHVFQEQYDNEMILDYITILYKNPMQKLPILVLLSKEQGTGKSTFLFLLKLIFKQNMTFISNSEFTGDFNAHWTSKLLVACEETIFDKKDAYEKLKNLNTAKYLNRNEKNKAQTEIPCMLHFVLLSNHENDFMRISRHDRRLWVRKVHPFKKQHEDADVNFDDKIEAEMPAFIHFLENREIKYKERGEFYFHQADFQTDAFRNLVAHSESTVVKEIRDVMQDYFLRYDVNEVWLTSSDLLHNFGIAKRYEKTYLNKILEEEFGAIRWQGEKVKRYSFFTEDFSDSDKINKVSKVGRPYQLKRKMFLGNEIIVKKKEITLKQLRIDEPPIDSDTINSNEELEKFKEEIG